MASDITAKEKLLEMDNEVLLIERERKCMNVSRFNLREYICGPRMRLYTAVKLLTSFTYAALLMTVIVNFNVIDTHLNKLNITKNNDIVADGSDRRQYYIVLWLGFLLCVLHSLTCVVTVVSSFCSRTREYLSHVVHVTWWLIFAMTAVIPIFSFILYFGFLPRAVQETFTQLSDAARTDYKSILPLQEVFDCCSVDFIPNANEPDNIQRFKPDNSNFSCAMRNMVVVKRLPPPILEPYVIYRSQEPKKETCTAKIMSHYPDKVRWVWILKASAIPHTAFGWIVVFDLIFIITAWSERGYYNVEDDEANEANEEEKMGTSINKPAHSSDLGYSNTRIIEQKPSNVSASNQPGAQLGFYAEKAKNENSQTSAIDQETDSEKLKKQWPEENTSIANDPPPSYAESESDAQRARGASLPSSTLREPEVGATKLLYPEPIGKTRALSNISERDTDVSASGSFSKSGSGSATSNESE